MTGTQPSPKPLKRAARRAIVLTCYLGYAGMVASWALLEQPLRWVFVLPLGLACILAMGALLMPQTLGVSDGSDEMLDERQLKIRNQTYLNAYRGLGLLVMIGALYAYIAADSGKWWMPRTSDEIQAAFWGVWLICVTLPAAIGAWNEPDPITD
jgi:hypothetical protein